MPPCSYVRSTTGYKTFEERSVDVGRVGVGRDVRLKRADISLVEVNVVSLTNIKGAHQKKRKDDRVSIAHLYIMSSFR